MCDGRLAQLVRAPALQAGGRRFEPCTAHQIRHRTFTMVMRPEVGHWRLHVANRASGVVVQLVRTLPCHPTSSIYLVVSITCCISAHRVLSPSRPDFLSFSGLPIPL